MTFSFAARTECGPVREKNEDNFLIDPRLHLYCVADGLGGRPGGEIASALAVNIFRATLKRHIKDLREFAKRKDGVEAIVALLKRACRVTNKAILEQSSTDASLTGMGCTMSALLLVSSRAFVVHIGDSRVYRLRQGTLEQLTADHTIASALGDGDKDPDSPTPSDAFHNQVTRAFGQEQRVEVDVTVLPIEDGDGFLLCTDGLYEYLNVLELQIMLDTLKAGSPDAMLEHLVQFAVDHGGRDNITAIWVGHESKKITDPLRPEVLEARVAALLKLDLFSGLNDFTLKKLARSLREHPLLDGEMLFPQGGLRQELPILIEGCIALSSDGVELEYYGGVTHLGISHLFNEAPSPFEARAMGPTTVLLLDGHIFRQLLENTDKGARILQRNVTSELSASVRKRSLAMSLSTSEHPVLQVPGTGPDHMNRAATVPVIPVVMDDSPFRREVTPMEIPLIMAEEEDGEHPERAEPEASVEIAPEILNPPKSAGKKEAETAPPPVPNGERIKESAQKALKPSVKSTEKKKKKKKAGHRRLTSEVRPPTPEELTGLFKSGEFFKALKDAGLERHIVSRK